MAAGSRTLSRYQLASVFQDEATVVHTSDDVQTWRTEHQLGSGPFGVVWRQREEESGQLRAVKIVSKLRLNVRELEPLMKLQDRPDLFVKFLGWFEDPDAIHVAMEYVERGNLAQYVEAYGAKAKTEVRKITSQILEALVVLHGRDVCHRDLKPQNILIASGSPVRIKLGDFGISKHTLETCLRSGDSDGGSGGGTVWWYHAPEQCGLLPKKMMRYRQSCDSAVDLWALGVVVHEILTSEIPFLDNGNPDNTTTVSQYCCGLDSFPSQSLHASGVGEAGIEFVESLMVVDPRGRVRAAAALKSAWLLETNSIEMERERLRSQLELLYIQVNAEFITLLFEAEDLTPIIKILRSDIGESKIRNHLCQAVAMGYLEFVNLVLITGKDTKFQLQEEKQLWLQLAARNCHIDVMKLLLDHGADVNAVPATPRGLTALQIVSNCGHLDAMNFLLGRGADVNGVPAPNGGMTALQAAAEGGYVDAMNLLLAHGADVGAVSGHWSDMTALQIAANGGHLDAMRVLLVKGADVDPVSMSYARKSPHMLALLRSYEKPHIFGVPIERGAVAG